MMITSNASDTFHIYELSVVGNQTDQMVRGNPFHDMFLHHPCFLKVLWIFGIPICWCIEHSWRGPKLDFNPLVGMNILK